MEKEKNYHQSNSQQDANNLYKPTNNILDKVAISAINTNVPIIPVGSNKNPLIKNWSIPKNWSCDPKKLKEWVSIFKNPYWGLPCGPDNGVFVIDIDLQKNETTGEICGTHKLGPLNINILHTASFMQFTQSTYYGSKGQHFFFKYEDRLSLFKNIRLKNTTIDIKTGGGQVVLYIELPEKQIWKNLTPMPDELFYILMEMFGISSSRVQKKEHRVYGPGKNNTANPQRASKAGYNQNTTQAAKDLKELFTNNANRPDFDWITHATDYLKLYEKNFFKKSNGLLTPSKIKDIEFKDVKPITEFIPNPKPREWLFNEKIFISRRPNQFTGDPGAGKSTFTRETAYRYWKAGGTVLLFAQEDSPSEDIAPFLIDKGFKEGEKIPRFFVFWDWYKYPPLDTISSFKNIKHKFIIIDPVHALFTDVSKPSQCRQILLNLRDSAMAEDDTIIFVNHPKSMWKENKLSGAELNASSKELGRICRGSTMLKLDANTGLNIIEHSKRQLNADRYSFNLVEAFIKNKENKICSFSKIEDFKAMKNKPASPDETILPQQKNLSERRKEIRQEISGCVGVFNQQESGALVARKTIIKALERLNLKAWEIDQELAQMVNEGILTRKSEGTNRLYRLVRSK